MMDKLNLLLIGGEERRNEIKDALRGRRDVRLAGEIGEANALRLAPKLDADIIVLDFAAERLNGLAALPWLAGLAGAAKIIVLAATGTASERRLAFDLGASSYVLPERAAALIGALAEQPAAQRSVMAARAA